MQPCASHTSTASSEETTSSTSLYKKELPASADIPVVPFSDCINMHPHICTHTHTHKQIVKIQPAGPKEKKTVPDQCGCERWREES